MDIEGAGFESKFQEIAKAAFGVDFLPTAPMGRRGDLKCDGYITSSRTIIQCYGPRYGKAEVSSLVNKINEDFRGAHACWGPDLMKRWVFVVNLFGDRLPSEMVKLVAELGIELGVEAQVWTRQEVLDLARSCSPDHRARLFGRAPTREDIVRRATYDNIGRALAFIRAKVLTSPLEVVCLPPAINAKAEWNLLPPSHRLWLSIGAAAADHVKRYLLAHVEPGEADRMAGGFVEKYQALKAEGIEPDKIFQHMLIFAGGATGDADADTAALAIVVHFFSTCEIFERPPEPVAT